MVAIMTSVRHAGQMFVIASIFIMTVMRGANVYFSRQFYQLQGVYYLLLIAFLVYYCLETIKRRYKPTAIEWYLIILLALPALSATRAFFVFGQPLLYGFLSDRRWLKAIGVMFLIYQVRKGAFGRQDLRTSVLSTGLICLFVYWLIYFFVDPGPLVERAFVALSHNGKGYVFRLNPLPVLILAYYSMFLWLKEGGIRFALLGVFSTFFLLFLSKGRMLSFAFLLSSALILVIVIIHNRWFLSSYYVRRLVTFGSVTAFLFFVLGCVFPEKIYNPFPEYYRIIHSIEKYVAGAEVPAVQKTPDSDHVADFIDRADSASLGAVSKYSQDNHTAKGNAFSSYGSSEKNLDTKLDRSSGLRILQIRKAFSLLNQSGVRWLLGVGNLSRHWHSGFESELGYFFATDIGLLGAIFLYGVLGMLVLSFHAVFMLRLARRQLQDNSSMFTIAVLGAWSVIAMKSLTGGYLAVFPGGWMMLLGLVVLEHIPVDTGRTDQETLKD